MIPYHCKACIFYDSETQACPAYPMGIPDDILDAERLHFDRQPDQLGPEVFTPIVGKVSDYRPSGDELPPPEAMSDSEAAEMRLRGNKKVTFDTRK